MASATTTRCRWSSPGARAPGSRTSTGAATSTPSPPTRRSTSAIAIRAWSPPPTSSSTGSRSPAAPSATTSWGRSAAALAELCGKERVLPMNTGAEAVETAIKAGAQVGLRGQGRGARAAGRRSSSAAATSTAARPRSSRFSDDPVAREGFGPYTPGFETRPVRRRWRRSRRASTTTPSPSWSSRSRARPGVIVPPDGYLGAGPGAVRARERAPDRRRDPVGPRPHRARPSPASTRASTPDMLHARQGARRRRSLPVSAVVGIRRGPRRVPARRARQHLRRQPARLRGRARGARAARRRLPAAARRRARRAVRASRSGRIAPRDRRDPPARALGRRRPATRSRDRERRLRAAARRPGCWPRRPRSERSGSPRR